MTALMITRLQKSCTAAGLALLLAACASTPPPPQLTSPEPEWSLQFSYPIAYHRVVNDELMLVATHRHLHGIDPSSGQKLWRLRNVNTTQRDAVNVPHERYILIQDSSGGAFDDAATHIIAVDRQDGRLHWESPPLPGRALQGVLDIASGRVFVVTVPSPHGDDRGFFHDILPGKGLLSGLEREPTLVALDLGDGSLLWQQDFGREIDLRPSTRLGIGGSGTSEGARIFDLELYHPPFLIEGLICLTYTGLRCYDMRTGELEFDHRLKVIDNDLARSYPSPLMEEGLIYVGDEEQVFAFQTNNGKRLWRSRDFNRMPELVDSEDLIIAQIGGRFFDLDSEQWRDYGPFAVAAINKRTGKRLWEFSRVFRSLSNVLVAEHKVWFADHQDLFALDHLDGSRYLTLPHQFSEPPTYVARNKRDEIVLIGEREIAGFSAQDGRMLWYHHYPPIEPGAWRSIAANLLSASGALFKFGSIILDYGGSALNVPRIRISGSRSLGTRSILESTSGSVGDSFSARAARLGTVQGFANLTGDTQYFLTQLEYQDQIVLAAVDIHSGKTKRLTALPVTSPNLVIDEVNNLVTQSEDNRLIAIPLY